METGEHERGIAIVSALWGSAIIAVIVLSVLQLIRADAGIGRSRADVAALTATADAAINIAILRLVSAPAAQPPVDATPFTIPFAGYEVRMSVRDEAGKIDANMANAATLQQALMSVGADVDVARQIAATIIAWREPPERGGRNEGASYSYLQSVEELQLVPGMTPELYRRVESLLTVYSHASFITPAFSTPAVLNVFRALDSGADAEYRRMEDERLGLRPRASSPGVSLGHAFTITAEVRGGGSARVVRTAVIRLTGQRQAPLLIYRWG